MDLQTSLQELGLSPRAGAAEIEQAYKSRSRALKTLILGASRTDLKEQRRAELRRLVVSKAVALGRTPPDDWSGEQLPVSTKRLLHRLERMPTPNLNRINARAFFGLTPDAPAAKVRRMYDNYKRVLIRRFAAAHDDVELNQIRRARRKLRTIRNFAI